MKNKSLIIFLSIIPLILKAHIITVDGDPSDWFSHSVSIRDTFFYVEHPGFLNDKVEAIWIDEIEDDVGDGDYTYPTDTISGGIPRFKNKEGDLIEFRLTEGATSTDTFLYFLIILGDTFNGGEDWPSFIAYFTIDTSTILQNSKFVPQYADIKIEGEWEFSCIFSMYNAVLLDANYNTLYSGVFAHQHNIYEAGIKIDSLNLYHKKFFGSLGIGLEDLGNFREVDSLASQYRGGGGISDWADPDVYDLAFIKKSNQILELSGYSSGTPAIIINAIKLIHLYGATEVKEKGNLTLFTTKRKFPIYDITGRKISTLKRSGIYISKDKKIIKFK